MADPLSVAASALAVAGAGGKLCQTLYIFIESVRKSEKQLKPVADYVKLTSAVLDNIGSLLGEKDVRDLCKDSLLGTTNEALDGCRQAFEDLKNFVDGLLKTEGNGKAKLGPWEKFTFLPFRQRELDMLMGSLERFKSELDLVLKVLHLSVSIKNNKGMAEIQALKLQVEHLIKAKEAAEKAIAENKASQASERLADATTVADAPMANTPTPIAATDGSSMPRSAPQMIARSFLVRNASIGTKETAAKSFMVMTASVPRPQNRVTPAANSSMSDPLASQRDHLSDQNQSASPAVVSRSTRHQSTKRMTDEDSNSDSEDELLRHLGRCADAVTKLSNEIERATRRWRNRRRYQRHGLTPAFETAHSAMKKLRRLEVDLEVSDGGDITNSGSEETPDAMLSRRSTRQSRRGRRNTERSRSAHRHLQSVDLAGAAVAGLASARLDERKRARRSRSRSQRRKSYSHSDLSDGSSPSVEDNGPAHPMRDRKIATAALASESVAMLWHRRRSRSRSRYRSRSRSWIRADVPIATVVPGDPALAALNEKQKKANMKASWLRRTEDESLELASSRSKPASDLLVVDDIGLDAGLEVSDLGDGGDDLLPSEPARISVDMNALSRSSSRKFTAQSSCEDAQQSPPVAVEGLDLDKVFSDGMQFMGIEGSAAKDSREEGRKSFQDDNTVQKPPDPDHGLEFAFADAPSQPLRSPLAESQRPDIDDEECTRLHTEQVQRELARGINKGSSEPDPDQEERRSERERRWKGRCSMSITQYEQDRDYIRHFDDSRVIFPGTERGGYRVSEKDRGRRGYHLCGPSINARRERPEIDDNDFKYTDAADMYNESEPIYRRPEARPRRTSAEYNGAHRRERPMSVVEPSSSKIHAGPPPSYRGWNRVNENYTAYGGRPGREGITPSHQARMPIQPARARTHRSSIQERDAQVYPGEDGSYYVPPVRAHARDCGIRSPDGFCQQPEGSWRDDHNRDRDPPNEICNVAYNIGPDSKFEKERMMDPQHPDEQDQCGHHNEAGTTYRKSLRRETPIPTNTSCSVPISLPLLRSGQPTDPATSGSVSLYDNPVQDYSAVASSDASVHDFSVVDDLLKKWTVLGTGETQ